MARQKKSGSRSKKRKGGSKKGRSAAARKAAKTRAAKHAARVRAGKKAARTRARKGGKRKGKRRAAREAMEPRKGRKGKRKGGKRKGGRRGKRMDTATHLATTRIKLANIQARYDAKLTAYKARLSKASDSEAARLRNALLKLEAQKDKEIARIKKNSESKLARLEAAERGRRRGGKRKGGKRGRRRGARRNPIGSSGGHEYLATAAGVLAAILLTIGPYKLIRSHALTPVSGGQGGTGGIDAPAQGDVPNLLTSQLPIWSRLKWRGLAAIGTVVVVDLVLPFTAAAMTEDGWRTFFQVWGFSAIALGGAKVTTDLLALATKSTLIGQRMFAAENTARDVRAQSANAQLPAISVAPGLGLPGMTGYGKPGGKCIGAGAGCCCDACGGKGGKQVPPGSPPGTGEPITGTTPMPAAPGTPGAPPLDQTNPANPGGGLPLGGPTRYSGAGSNVTPINRFEPKNRFDGSVLRK